MTGFVQPATALPSTMSMQPTMTMSRPMVAPQAQQQLPYMGVGGYGMPMGYGMPQMGYGSPYGMGMQPVYFNSMSQLPPGAIPVSQGMLAQALGQGQAGAQMVQPEQGGSRIGSALKGAAIGAAAGAAFGLIPFLPLGLFSGAIVGAIGGAILGFVKGGKKEGEFHTMEQQQAMAAAQAQAGMIAATPEGARSAAVPAEAAP
jgi:hypothetical protein